MVKQMYRRTIVKSVFEKPGLTHYWGPQSLLIAFCYQLLLSTWAKVYIYIYIYIYNDLPIYDQTVREKMVFWREITAHCLGGKLAAPSPLIAVREPDSKEVNNRIIRLNTSVYKD